MEAKNEREEEPLSFWESEKGQVTKDTIAGACGGLLGLTLGYPLDTIKVRLQVEGTAFGGVWDCLSRTIRNEGLRGLYQGISSPISGYAISNAISFSIYGRTLRMLKTHFPKDDQGGFDIAESSVGSFLGGFAAGAGLTTVNNPLDRVKIMMQSQLRNKDLRFPTAWSCAKWVYSNQGLRSFYFGWSTNVVVGSVGSGIWYGTYHFTKTSLLDLFYPDRTRSPGSPAPPVPIALMIVSGGAAGAVSWTCIFPGDVLRSRVMKELNPAQPAFRSGFDCLRKSIQSEGYSWCYRGLTPTLMRAIPVGAVILSVNETVHKWLDKF